MGTDGTTRDENGSLATAVVVAAWFVLNIAMGSSTKWLYIHGTVCRHKMIEDPSAEPDCVHYKFPLAITVLHMGFSWATCYVWLHQFRGVSRTSHWSFDKQRKTIAPLALVFALSVAMGNLSLQYIYPSFNQMLGSMSPLITVVMAVGIEGKRFNMWTWLSMPVLCGGLGLCSAEEVNFHWLGAIFCMGATILRGLKSIMQGSIMSKKEDKLDAVTLLYYMAPWAAAVLSVLGLFLEGIEPWTLLFSGLYADPMSGSNVTGVPKVLALLCFSGLNACLLNVFNFLVTHYTSAVAQQVLGNVKSCMSIAISVMIFGNELKMVQALGIGICLFGVWMFQKWGGPAVKPVSAADAAYAEDDSGQHNKQGSEMHSVIGSQSTTATMATMGTEARS